MKKVDIDKRTPSKLVYKDDRAIIGVRSKTPIVKRVRAENEALPVTNDIWARGTYRTGMGDYTHMPVRPGADDHKQFKSLRIEDAQT